MAYRTQQTDGVVITG